jgi:hypothetical protein
MILKDEAHQLMALRRSIIAEQISIRNARLDSKIKRKKEAVDRTARAREALERERLRLRQVREEWTRRKEREARACGEGRVSFFNFF